MWEGKAVEDGRIVRGQKLMYEGLFNAYIIRIEPRGSVTRTKIVLGSEREVRNERT